jgi:bifunctional DNase/RNase
LICYTENDTVEIDSRTSDAIALAVRFGCPIYTYDYILENAGILMDDLESGAKKNIEAVGVENDLTTNSADDLSRLNLTELNDLLNTVLENEDYIKAIAIRDEINKWK